MTIPTTSTSMGLILMATLLVPISSMTPVLAQTNSILQNSTTQRNTSPRNISPQNSLQGDLERQPLPLEPPPLPEDIPDPNLQVPSPENNQLVPSQDDFSIVVERFEITGNTVFSDSALLSLPLWLSELEINADTNIDTDADTNTNTSTNRNEAQSCLQRSDLSSSTSDTIGTVANEVFSLNQLFQVSVAVTRFYHCEGYGTSGAKLVIPESTIQTGRGIVEVQVIEGMLEDVQVISNTRRSIFTLNNGYVRSRLHLDLDAPLNVANLQESLQLLQLDPLIENVAATLQDGTRLGESRLRVQFKDASYRPLVVSGDNGRSPSIGSFQQRFQLDTPNIFGVGDSLRFAYTRTDGSNGAEFGYRIPFTDDNTTLSLRYSTTSSEVIEPPFDDIDNDGNGPDIESESQVYEATLRQPVSRTVSDRTFREFAIGVTASSQRTKSELLDLPFPSVGSDADGVTNILALRFFQEWTQQNATEVVALRSQFNFGLDGANSTINEPVDNAGPIPDSRFLSWQGQAQWVRVLGRDTLLQLRGNVQLADNVLLPAEQFAIGGTGSVRGYRQDQLQADNGVFGSLEARLPIIRHRRSNSVVHLVPFFDWGHVWNATGSVDDVDPNTIAALGLGVQWQWSDRITARFEYGVPLVNIESRDRTWQENGLLFSVQVMPF